MRASGQVGRPGRWDGDIGELLPAPDGRNGVPPLARAVCWRVWVPLKVGVFSGVSAFGLTLSLGLGDERLPLRVRSRRLLHQLLMGYHWQIQFHGRCPLVFRHFGAVRPWLTSVLSARTLALTDFRSDVSRRSFAGALYARSQPPVPCGRALPPSSRRSAHVSVRPSCCRFDALGPLVLPWLGRVALVPLQKHFHYAPFRALSERR